MSSLHIIDSKALPRRGAVVVFVLIAVAIAFMLGLTYLSTCTTTTTIARVLNQHAQARQVSESGLAIAREFIRSVSDWSAVAPSGDWFVDRPLLGGTVTVTATYLPELPVDIVEPSFEEFTGQLANPVLAPPMSGSVGAWTLLRTALVQTGATVPRIGIEQSLSSTDGANRAFIRFGATVNGTGEIEQELTESLNALTTYTLAVDVATSGLPPLSSSIDLRVAVGNQVIASTTTAYTLELPSLPDQLPELPQSPPSNGELTSLLEVLDLGSASAVRYELTFTTTDIVPTGHIRVELFANSIGIQNAVLFDNIRFSRLPETPIVLTSTGKLGDASYRITEKVVKELGENGVANVRTVRWIESES